MGDSVVAKRLFRSYLILLLNRVTFVDLVELDMVDFFVILGMNLLHACFVSINCKTRVVKFQFPHELIFEWKGGTQSLEVELFRF